jgi:hypothetical protein
MLTSFTQTCESNGAKEPWISTVECLRTVAAVEAAYRSIHSGGWEMIDMKGMRERRNGVKVKARARA